MAINARNKIATGKLTRLSVRKPAIRQIAKTMSPCMRATVAPPSTRPIMMRIRGTGATSVSFRKPNWRSQMSSIPEKIEVNNTVIAITPGARNWM
jgi:hypothetical protein